MSWLDFLEFEFMTGDLLEIDVEAITVTVPTSLVLGGYGSIGKRLVERSGGRPGRLFQDVFEKIRHLDGQKLPLGEVVSLPVLPAYQLGDLKRLILCAQWDRDNDYTHHLVYAMTINALREALANQITSIAVPVFTTGNHGMTVKMTAKALHDLDEREGSESSSVRRLIFVSIHQDRVKFFQENLDRELDRLRFTWDR